MSLNHPNNRIAIITCCPDDWGGSEDLWSASARFLQTRGYAVTAYKETFNTGHPEVKKLQNSNIRLVELRKNYSLLQRVSVKIYNKIFSKNRPQLYTHGRYSLIAGKYLKKHSPALAIINQGINFDGLSYAYQCMQLNIPYCIIAHKAVEFYWPGPSERKIMADVFKKAECCYFVSEHNKTLTEEQFGIRFTNARVIWNPIKLEREVIPYPSEKNIYRLACIGRLFIIDKGQDILLRILSREPWRSRPLEVSFIGSGVDEDGLKELAGLLTVKNVKFVGYKTNIADTWKNYHALILPSRSEGMPLTVIEAMLAGRVVITTNAGGNAEIIENGVTGFIGEANEKDFEKTMEEAWSRKEEWEQMGLKANAFISKVLPPDPEKIFAASIITFIKK